MAQSLSLHKEPVSSANEAETTTTTPTCESVPNEPTMAVTQAGEDILQRLARQVEYYFSTTNLEKDTYVATLRDLNDGYVPISIIANFGKVRSLVPYDGLNAVRLSATEFSELLEVVLINTDTGKRTPADQTADASMKTVEAVGPISGKPIPPSEIKSSASLPLPSVKPPSPSSSAAVQNTIVVREVPEGTGESQIRQLFTFKNCPAIQSLTQDVANCWFVTMDTSSRDTMLDVMFELRKQKFESGEPVLARLKTAAAVNRDITSNVGYFASDVTQMIAQQNGANRFNNGGRKNKKKKNNNKSNKGTRNNNNNNSQNRNTKGKNNNNNNGARRNSGGKQQKKSNGQEPQKQETRPNNQNKNGSLQQSPPPNFGEDHFPALPTEDSLANLSKIEVEKVPDHDEMGKNNNPATASDSSSTATTSTSSSKSPQQPIVMGGYAAALLKATKVQPAPEKTAQQPKAKAANNNNKENADKKVQQSKNKIVPKQEPAEEMAPVNIQPPSWGKGSFADILRRKDAAVTAE